MSLSANPYGPARSPTKEPAKWGEAQEVPELWCPREGATELPL